MRVPFSNNRLKCLFLSGATMWRVLIMSAVINDIPTRDQPLNRPNSWYKKRTHTVKKQLIPHIICINQLSLVQVIARRWASNEPLYGPISQDLVRHMDSPGYIELTTNSETTLITPRIFEWFLPKYAFGSRRCDGLFTWFCYQLIAQPGNKTTKPSRPDPFYLKWKSS